MREPLGSIPALSKADLVGHACNPTIVGAADTEGLGAQRFRVILSSTEASVG